MPDKKEHLERTPEAGVQPERRPRVIIAEDLFQGDREVWLEHTGVRYRLRITRRNKLILQK